MADTNVPSKIWQLPKRSQKADEEEKRINGAEATIVIVDESRQITLDVLEAMRHLEPYPVLTCSPPMIVVGEPDFSLAKELMPEYPLMLHERIPEQIMSIRRFDFDPYPTQKWEAESKAGPTGHPTRHRKQWRIRKESRKRNRRK